MVQTIEGSCHCGAVRLRVPWTGQWRDARRCNCSFCSRRYVPVASVDVVDVEVIDPEGALSTYEFGTGVAKHHFCSRCGIYTHHKRRSKPDECGVNIACFPGTDVTLYNDVPTFDGISHPNDR